MNSTSGANLFGSPQKLCAFWPDVSTSLYCPPPGGEEEGKHFCLLSLVYVIDAETSNSEDKRSISGNGHTGNLCADKLSAHHCTQ